MNTLKIITAAILFFLLFSVSVLFVLSSQMIDEIERQHDNQKGLLEIVKMQDKEIDLLMQIEKIQHGNTAPSLTAPDSSFIGHGYSLDSVISVRAYEVDTFCYKTRPRKTKRK